MSQVLTQPEIATRETLATDVEAPRVDAAVVLRDISKSYSRGQTTTRVLDSIDLTVQQGECVFLLGPSGCGKTTLLSIMGCVLSPDAGTVEILGQDPQQLGTTALADLRRQHLGFVFQRYHLIRGLSALENVCVPLTLSNWSTKRSRIRGLELLEQVGLTDKATSQPNQLSIGQCQRVALARALAADPGLVLADEPTAALDAETGQQAMQLLRKLTVETGKTAIIVTHDQRILHYADRVIRLEEGRLVEEKGVGGKKGSGFRVQGSEKKYRGGDSRHSVTAGDLGPGGRSVGGHWRLGGRGRRTGAFGQQASDPTAGCQPGQPGIGRSPTGTH